MVAQADLGSDVRLFVYRFFVDQGRAPTPPEIAAGIGRAQAEVEGSLRRLHDNHMLVLAPGSHYIWMANPLSAVPTAFQVHADRRAWFGNCIWDALGVIAMLGTDGEVRTWCPDCADEMVLSVRDGAVSGRGVAHFLVPAARWWDDIGFT